MSTRNRGSDFPCVPAEPCAHRDCTMPSTTTATTAASEAHRPFRSIPLIVTELALNILWKLRLLVLSLCRRRGLRTCGRLRDPRDSRTGTEDCKAFFESFFVRG